MVNLSCTTYQTIQLQLFLQLLVALGCTFFGSKDVFAMDRVYCHLVIYILSIYQYIMATLVFNIFYCRTNFLDYAGLRFQYNTYIRHAMGQITFSNYTVLLVISLQLQYSTLVLFWLLLYVCCNQPSLFTNWLVW